MRFTVTPQSQAESIMGRAASASSGQRMAGRQNILGAIPRLSAILVVYLVLAGCATVAAREPVTVGQIVAMSQAGTPAADIIAKIRDSDTVYRLKASQLAELERKGVPPDVIDSMQKTYLEAVRRDQSVRDWNLWTLGDDGYWYGGCGYDWGPSWCG